MASFPPIKGSRTSRPAPSHVTESGPFSTGEGGLAKSKAVKNAGIKPSPGLEKVNSAS